MIKAKVFAKLGITISYGDLQARSFDKLGPLRWIFHTCGRNVDKQYEMLTQAAQMPFLEIK